MALFGVARFGDFFFSVWITDFTTIRQIEGSCTSGMGFKISSILSAIKYFGTIQINEDDASGIIRIRSLYLVEWSWDA